jgi:hypothetical protein
MAKSSMAFSVMSGMSAKGDAGCGFCRAWVKAWMAAVAVSVDEVGGMVQPVGKNCTVLMVRSELVEAA